ncbi:hypothetical protein Slin15195_G096910 [Septoria linicola]|uniref:Xylanolytic transcriptional activator regulatory domain-containing protein n=1 Tax=Septoria linicola TaxID=215465 RepID=A0A9Q9EN93_9PEZI|nr:hypothetical protein Slin14017_G060000 [Septoria linicola]USW56372.1 hypothetical protein Slin15195_G096910 [Septoria linicola]
MTCISRNAGCTYLRLEEADPSWENSHADFTVQWLPWHDALHLDQMYNGVVNFLRPSVTDSSVESHSLAHDAKAQVSLRFLEKSTRDQGLTASLDCASEDERSQVAGYTSRQSHEPSDLEILQFKSKEILLLIAEICCIKPRNSAVDLSWSSSVERDCQRFFSAGNIRLFLEVYWAIWSPNVPLLHKPTFDVAKAKPVLVAAMVTIGASMSPAQSDRSSARQFYNAVEETVFYDDDFCANEDSSMFPSKAKVQSLQAAYVVMLVQNWEGSHSSKRRIRRFRYSTVIAIARNVGLKHTRHPNYTDLSFDWHSFVLREELIRVFLWIFLLDTAFVIFNNVPPRMAIKEMQMDFAVREVCFQACSAEECLHLIMERVQEQRRLSATCEMMCKGLLHAEEAKAMSQLGSVNLFVITSAIHSMIFQVQQSFSSQLHLQGIYAALANWHLLWQQHLDLILQKEPLSSNTLASDIHDLWKREGFSRHASEYWMLASMLVQRLDSTREWHASDVQSKVEEDAADTFLEKYDETSMRQINDLITDFQRTII